MDEDGRVTAGIPTSVAGTTPDPSAVNLGALFHRGSSGADRARALRDLADVARRQLQGLREAAVLDRALIADQSAPLLTELASRLPIRTAESLVKECGTDPEAQARQVVQEAARLAGLLDRIPPLPGVGAVALQVVRLVASSAIEVRMVGELYAVYGEETAVRDQRWLNMVLLAWACGQPVTLGGSAASNAAMLARKLRSIATNAIGDGWLGGAGGSDRVTLLGQSLQRRMRLHPSTWLVPQSETVGEVVRKVAWEEVRARVPASVLRIVPGARPSIAGAGTAEPDSPSEALALAWVLHDLARSRAGDLPTSDPVRGRLESALAAQERHLEQLSQRLGHVRSPVRVQHRPTDRTPSEDAWAAEDVIDRVLELGRRPRRLPAWTDRRRAGLVYCTTALVVAVSAAAAYLASSGTLRSLLLVAEFVALPWLTLAVSAAAIGWLFRPRLGGRVRRHPFTGALIVIGVHALVGLIVAVIGLL